MEKVDKDLKEIRPHGNRLFPINVYETVVDAKFQLPLFYHWHPEIEILIVIDGKARFQINEKEMIVDRGDILLIKGNTLHGSYYCFHRHLEFRSIVFDYSLIAGMTNDLIEQRYLKILRESNSEKYILISSEEDKNKALFKLTDEIYHLCKEKTDGYELLIKAMLFQLIYYIYKLYQRPLNLFFTEHSDVIMMRKIIQYSKEHCREKLLLADISKELSISEGYFCRFFKKNFHMTYGKYLQGIRMQEAERMLKETDLSIEEIALNTGFSSGNYFTIVFKKMNHMTPLVWRKQNR